MENITTALRYFTDSLDQGVRNEIGDGTHPWTQRLQNAVLPAILGTKVVMTISLIERAVIDTENKSPNSPKQGTLQEKLTNLGFIPNHSEFQELAGLQSIRHCFAHEFGKVTERQKQTISNFLNELRSNKIIDESGNIVTPYFEIKDNNIYMKEGVSNRLRLLAWTIIKYLASKGLTIDKNPA